MKLTTLLLAAASVALSVFAVALYLNVLAVPAMTIGLAAMPLAFLSSDYGAPRRGYRHDRRAARDAHALPLAA